MVPVMIAIMVWAFSTYLALKGLKKIWKMDFMTAASLGLGIAIISYFIIAPIIKRYAASLPNKKKSINKLFTWPLIFAAALLSFAHGANDVANAVGPLAAISDAVTGGGVSSKVAIPMWVMVVGAVGIAIGLALFGPKLIRTVGTEITELDQMRAYCVAMAAAITVIIASQLGLPVSSTHIAVGGVFGVGFLREYLKTNYDNIIHDIKHHHSGKDQAEVEHFLNEFDNGNIEDKSRMLTELKKKTSEAELSKKERKRLRKLYRHELVKRSAIIKIGAAWIVTVPVSASMAAMLFFMIRGMMLP